ncbi:MAG: hypothetical protein P8L18_08755 [Verrucomicrobiota bacterium]|nr:hypothetical protein [Verrucomicrobiota bacterium]
MACLCYLLSGLRAPERGNCELIMEFLVAGLTAGVAEDAVAAVVVVAAEDVVVVSHTHARVRLSATLTRFQVLCGLRPCE